MPGNLTLFKSFPLNNFIYFNLAIPSTKILDFSSCSLSINKDLIMLFVAPVCIFYSLSTSSTADFLVLRDTPLVRWLKLVLTKLFLVLQESFIVVATMLMILYTLI